MFDYEVNYKDRDKSLQQQLNSLQMEYWVDTMKDFKLNQYKELYEQERVKTAILQACILKLLSKLPED